MAKRTKTVAELTEEQLAKRRLVKKLSARKSRATKRAVKEAIKAEADLVEACHKKLEERHKLYDIEKEAAKDHIERIQRENPAFPFVGDLLRCRTSPEMLQPNMYNILILVVIILQIPVSKQAMHQPRLWTKFFAEMIKGEIENQGWEPSAWWNLGRINAVK